MNAYLKLCFVVALLLSMPAIATAEDKITIWPTRDVTVTSTITNPTQNGPKDVNTTMMYQSAQQRMRINTDLAVAGQPVGYSIIDYKTHKAITVMPAMHMYMETANNKMSIQEALNDTTIQKEKIGTSTVAGLACSIWEIKFKDNSGKSCITDDGVVLSYEGNVPSGKNGAAQKMSMLATSVKYGPLDDKEFKAPEGYQVFSPGNQMNMLKGMMKNMGKQQ